jgi:hypothetical protein
MLVVPASTDVAMCAGEPDLTKLSIWISLRLIPHRTFERRSPFIQSNGVKCVVNPWVDLDAFEANLSTISAVPIHLYM